MTLVVACYTPAGIAMSADSRTTAMRMYPTDAGDASAGGRAGAVEIPWVISDSTRKLFCVQDRYAVGTWGDGFIDGLPTSHYVSDFLLQQAQKTIASTEALADALCSHFVALAPSANLYIAIAGYDGMEPFVYQVDVAANTTKRRNSDADNKVWYGLFYGGDCDVVERLLGGGRIEAAWQLMNLQDAVDLSRHLVRTTMDQMRFETRVPTVGGLIETVTLTPARARYLVRNELHM